MNLPGFTAEAAIYRNTNAYRQNTGGALSPDGVMPQSIWNGSVGTGGGGGGGGTYCICLLPLPFRCHPRIICSGTLGCIIEWVCGDSGCWLWLCP
jgi:hypothetical protein